MEFPHLGQHCNEKTCNKLDFLPMKCDACKKVFCSSHFNYEQHSCSSGLRKDHQVPLCPLCGEPVPTAPGVEPDLTVGQHIDKQCKSDSRKVFTNRCSYKSCKRKELIPVNCSQCKRNFCLRHRHTADHECQSTHGVKITTSDAGHKRSMAANAAEQRRTQKPPNTLFNTALKPTTAAVKAAATQRLSAGSSQTQNIQGNISEDEALARAIAISIMELDETNDRNRRNETAASSDAQRRNNTTVPVGGQQENSAKDKCLLS